jgi:hypothetical protein
VCFSIALFLQLFFYVENELSCVGKALTLSTFSFKMVRNDRKAHETVRNVHAKGQERRMVRNAKERSSRNAVTLWNEYRERKSSRYVHVHVSITKELL